MLVVEWVSMGLEGKIGAVTSVYSFVEILGFAAALSIKQVSGNEDALYIYLLINALIVVGALSEIIKMGDRSCSAVVILLESTLAAIAAGLATAQ